MTNLLIDNEKLLADWNYDGNQNVDINNVTIGSNKKFSWKCHVCSYVWITSPNNRNQGRGCPYCAGKVVWPRHNDICTTDPAIAAEWNKEKNGDLTANDVAPMSNRAFWWKCSICNYEWHAIVGNRVKGRGCPNCAHIHQTSIPEQIVYHYVKQRFDDAINGYVSELISPYSIDIFIPSLNIGVEYDGERWHKDVKKDMRKSIRIKEAGIKLIRLREKGCFFLNDNSIQIKVNNPEYKSYEYLNSTIIELFDVISKMLGERICIEPDCADISRRITSVYKDNMIENSLGEKNKQLAAEWDYEMNGTLTPYHVKLKSNKKVGWICHKCGGQWMTTICDRTEGKGCPVCAGKRVMVGYNDLKTKNPSVAREWNYRKNAPWNPEEFTCGSSKKVWWICSKCNNEWQANIRNRAVLHSACPECSRKKRKQVNN
ncbi:MAG: zinc-ribbon domain-containing protein [Lachnospiraceae bacterium]|nr:zinc-ribbon domain-containing protein [Lachnospiraceae bacterium]